MMLRRAIAYAACVVGLAGLVAGCWSGNDGSGPTGSLAITIGAAGAPAAAAVHAPAADGGEALSHLKAAVIMIEEIEARMADGAWVPVDKGLPEEVDLIAIINPGNGVRLPADLLPEGDYDALELSITQVQLTLMDDTTILIKPPGSMWTVQAQVNFSVIAGESTVVKLNLRFGSSFRLFDGEFEFDPEFEVEGVEHG